MRLLAVRSSASATVVVTALLAVLLCGSALLVSGSGSGSAVNVDVTAGVQAQAQARLVTEPGMECSVWCYMTGELPALKIKPELTPESVDKLLRLYQPLWMTDDAERLRETRQQRTYAKAVLAELRQQKWRFQDEKFKWCVNTCLDFALDRLDQEDLDPKDGVKLRGWWQIIEEQKMVQRQQLSQQEPLGWELLEKEQQEQQEQTQMQMQKPRGRSASQDMQIEERKSRSPSPNREMTPLPSSHWQGKMEEEKPRSPSPTQSQSMNMPQTWNTMGVFQKPRFLLERKASAKAKGGAQANHALVPWTPTPTAAANEATAPRLPSLASPLHRLAQRLLADATQHGHSLLSTAQTQLVQGGRRGAGDIYMWRFIHSKGPNKDQPLDHHYKIGQNSASRQPKKGCERWSTRVRESIKVAALPSLDRNYEILRVWSFGGDSLMLEGRVHTKLADAGFPRLSKVIADAANNNLITPQVKKQQLDDLKVGLKSGHTEVFELDPQKLQLKNLPTDPVAYVNSLVLAAEDEINKDSTVKSTDKGKVSDVCEKSLTTVCKKCD